MEGNSGNIENTISIPQYHISMRRRYTRRSSPRSVVQSYKKVINYAPTSQPAATTLNYIAVTGQDSVAAGQTGVTDTNVPTGSVVKYIEIQYSVTNLVAIASHQFVSIQLQLSGQSVVDPQAVGGTAQRNQVHFQLQFNIGKDQNSNHIFRFKVPKKYQRVREGMIWNFAAKGDTVHTGAVQMIYKFYR